jgi:type IV secretion system protein VirB10
VTAPADPPGFERVYEGAMLSAVLVTQLDGDFAGPVLAQVAIPFYSHDRQRILVPRGARLLGVAQAVGDQDQSRLAVGFHRMVWPDGRWVDLGFHGLNQIGESALRDEVNRHYWSMFAAAGAVGVLAGLTMQGSEPYAGGMAGFRSGAGQGFGQSATQIMQRFLNRMPTVTIRAGHRLRVWVTSDFLVPRPAPHPERMYR